MKTIKKMTLVVLMLITTLCYAEKRNTVTFSKVAVVEFVNAKKGQKLLVKDEYGIILHSETIKNSGDLSKAFDLNKLKNGLYTIELEKDFEIVIKPFEIKNSKAVFLTSEESTIFKPNVRTENNKLLVSQMTLGSNPIEVEIYYDGSLIYSESINGEKTMNRIYKLSETETGNYHAIIKSDDRTYVEYFEL